MNICLETRVVEKYDNFAFHAEKYRAHGDIPYNTLRIIHTYVTYISRIAFCSSVLLIQAMNRGIQATSIIKMEKYRKYFL